MLNIQVKNTFNGCLGTYFLLQIYHIYYHVDYIILNHPHTDMVVIINEFNVHGFSSVVNVM